MAQSDESALLVRMEASLAKFEKQMAKGYAAADKAANMIEGRLGTMGNKVAKSAESSANAMVKELDSLRSKYDPLFAASKKYEAELEQVNRAWKVGAINAQQHGAAVDRLNAQYLSLTNAADDVGDAALRQGNTTRMFAMQLSQVGQQAMATGNVVQALAIQLPDMGLAFGAVGAAVGLLGGVALPMLWSALQGAGGEMGLTAEQAERLRAALDGASDASRSTQMEIDKLRFGVDEEYQVELLQEQVRLRREINAKVGEGQAYLASTTDSLDRQQMVAAGINAEVATMATRHNEITNLLADQESRAVQLAISQGVAAQAAGEAAARLGDASAAAHDLALTNMTGPIAAAASSAAELARNLGVSLGIAQKMMAGGFSGSKAPVLDPRDPRYDAGAAARATNFGFSYGTSSPFSVASVGAGSSGSRGSSGGGARTKESIFATSEAELQRIQREIELLGRNSQEVAKLKAQWAMLDAAKKQGIDLDKVAAGSSQTLREQIDAQAESVANLTLELEAQKISREKFEKGITDISDAMANALVGGKSLREGLADVFRGIALDLAKSGIQKGIMSLFSGGGGLFGGLFGGGAATGALGLPSFDGGGRTSMGARSGGIDGKGGFPAILHPRETVIDDTKGGRGAANIVVTAYIDEGVLVNVSGAVAERRIRSAKPGIVKDALSATHKAMGRTKSFGGGR